MEFFDSLIDDFYSLLNGYELNEKIYNRNNMWQCNDHLQIVMQRDTAFELNGIGFNLVTSRYIDDVVCVIGDDLPDIRSNSGFARVCVVSIEDTDDEQAAHNIINKLDFTKYHFFPDGYMMRASTHGYSEKVRVSESAIKKGISFYNVGNDLINIIKQNPKVNGVKVYYICLKGFDYSALQRISGKCADITKALDHVMSSVNFDCNACNLKPICDEVEGLRELHFKDKM